MWILIGFIRFLVGVASLCFLHVDSTFSQIVTLMVVF